MVGLKRVMQGWNSTRKRAKKLSRMRSIATLLTWAINFVTPLLVKKLFGQHISGSATTKKITNIPPLFESGKYISNFKDKASIFNNYFALQCQPFDIHSNLPAFTPLTSNSLTDITFSHAKIIAIIKQLDLKKANGPDEITAAMLKICPDEVARPLFLIFQKCLELGSFPSAWKHANVQPVHKKIVDKTSLTTGRYRYFAFAARYLKKSYLTLCTNFY